MGELNQSSGRNGSSAPNQSHFIGSNIEKCLRQVHVKLLRLLVNYFKGNKNSRRNCTKKYLFKQFAWIIRHNQEDKEHDRSPNDFSIKMKKLPSWLTGIRVNNDDVMGNDAFAALPAMKLISKAFVVVNDIAAEKRNRICSLSTLSCILYST